MAASMVKCFVRNNNFYSSNLRSASYLISLQAGLKADRCFATLESMPKPHAQVSAIPQKTFSPGDNLVKTQPWQLMSAACLERLPIITQEMSPIEKKYQDLMSAVDFENSCLSDHELRLIEDRNLFEKKSKEDSYDDTESEAGSHTTAVEEQDAWEDESEAFTRASRITDADKKKDIRSIHRRLDKKLILIVNQRLDVADKHNWVLPMGIRREGESMRQCAERVLSNLCGSGLQARFIGNAPCSFYSYRYPTVLRETSGFIGAKVFFFKAQYSGGAIVPNKTSVSDFMWLSKNELKPYLQARYHYKIKQFILEL